MIREHILSMESYRLLSSKTLMHLRFLRIFLMVITTLSGLIYLREMALRSSRIPISLHYLVVVQLIFTIVFHRLISKVAILEETLLSTRKSVVEMWTYLTRTEKMTEDQTNSMSTLHRSLYHTSQPSEQNKVN